MNGRQPPAMLTWAFALRNEFYICTFIMQTLLRPLIKDNVLIAQGVPPNIIHAPKRPAEQPEVAAAVKN
jgi:hypothetical protein